MAGGGVCGVLLEGCVMLSCCHVVMLSLYRLFQSSHGALGILTGDVVTPSAGGGAVQGLVDGPGSEHLVKCYRLAGIPATSALQLEGVLPGGSRVSGRRYRARETCRGSTAGQGRQRPVQSILAVQRYKWGSQLPGRWPGAGGGGRGGQLVAGAAWPSCTACPSGELSVRP